MELVRGRTLAQLTPEGVGLPLSVVIEILRQAALGLEHAHGIQVDGRQVLSAHRDLKPSNLMLNRDGVVKVMDFGIAKAATNAGASTATGLTKGTPTYMSPEQAEGEAVDARSDLFSLAAIAFELASGERLFGGDSLMAVMMAVLQVEIRVAKDARFSTLESAAPHFAGVLRRCLRYSPQDRYPSMTELLSDLEALKNLHPTTGSFRAWSRRAIGVEAKAPRPSPSSTIELEASSEVSLEAVTPAPSRSRPAQAPQPPPAGRLGQRPTPSPHAFSPPASPQMMAETAPSPHSSALPVGSAPRPAVPRAARHEEVQNGRDPNSPPTSKDTLAATRLVPNRKARRRRRGIGAAVALGGAALLVFGLWIRGGGEGLEEEAAGLDQATTADETTPELPPLDVVRPLEALPDNPADEASRDSGGEVGAVVRSTEGERAEGRHLVRRGRSTERAGPSNPNGAGAPESTRNEPDPADADPLMAPVAEQPTRAADRSRGAVKSDRPPKGPRSEPVDRGGNVDSAARQARAVMIDNLRRDLDVAGYVDPRDRVERINEALKKLGYGRLSRSEERAAERLVERTGNTRNSESSGSRKGTRRDSGGTRPSMSRPDFIRQALGDVPGAGNAEIRLYLVEQKLKQEGYRALDAQEKRDVLKYRPATGGR